MLAAPGHRTQAAARACADKTGTDSVAEKVSVSGHSCVCFLHMLYWWCPPGSCGSGQDVAGHPPPQLCVRASRGLNRPPPDGRPGGEATHRAAETCCLRQKL